MSRIIIGNKAPNKNPVLITVIITFLIYSKQYSPQDIDPTLLQ